LRLAYILVPISGTLIAMAVMKNYDLTEERAHEVRLQLEAKRGVRAVT
jgi:GPH family glycoside/pentoside/hexuronide:cation symporter